MGFREAISSLENCSCGREHKLKFLIEISESAMEKTPKLLEQAGMPKRLHVVADKNTLAASGDLPKLLESEGYLLSYTVFDDMKCADIPTAEYLAAEIKDAQGFLAVGTGSVDDICRIAAFRTKLPYALFATAPSMDGFASSTAPMIEKGYKRTYYVNPPNAVIADTNILAKSPQILKAAGIGDVLGKFIALVDWKVAHLLTGEYYCENVAKLVRKSAETALDLAYRVKEETQEVAGAVMEALVLPGIAMDFCGSSRPASGAEHYLSHCWEVIFLRDNHPGEFHGRKVGAASVIMANIYKRLSKLENPTFKRKHMDLDDLERYYTSLFPEMVKDIGTDTLDSVDIKKLEECWPRIREILSEIPDAKVISDALKAAGGAVRPEDVHVDGEFARSSLIKCRYIRNRLTTFRLMDMLDLSDRFCFEALE